MPEALSLSGIARRSTPGEPTASTSSRSPDAADALDEVLASAAPGRRRRWWIPGIVALAVAVVLWARPRGESSSASPYRTEPVERGTLVATVSATGSLAPTQQVDVGSELSGTVAEVLVDTNDTVVAGQVLARLDTTKLEQQTERTRAAAAAARARLQQAEASRAVAAADLRRYEGLHRRSDGELVSQLELDAVRATSLRADAATVAAEADVAEAEASLRSQENDLARSVLRAPIDGIVLDRAVEPGQTVAASFQAPVLFTLAESLHRMELTVYVSEADVGSVEAGQTAFFTVDAWPDRPFRAEVRKVRYGSKTVDNVVSYEAELEVINDDLALRPGMTASAEIQVAERRDVLLVSAAALRFRPPAAESDSPRGFSMLPRPPENPSRSLAENGTAVYRRLEEEGRLVRTPVTVGLSDGKRTEVRGETLREGDPVAVEWLGGTEP